jgi:sterol 3beta-glucosyltransferase
VGNLPHSWLFKRVSAVCHHGGAGTAAAGFKAGVPSMIMPFSNDQFAWAYRSYDLGVGVKPLNRKKLNARELAEAIKLAHSDQIVANAKKLAAAISVENGAGDCAKVISQLL